MAGAFTYQNLSRSGREIRLLELFSSNHHLGKVRPTCRLFHTSLDEDPPFLALSYVWGDSGKKRVILVDKRPFRVTRNLFDAMMGLRETESLIIWIDAICINQTNDDEKAWQVGLMGDLYQKAFGVLAWIGAPADNSDAVIDHLNTLGKQAEECGLHQTPEGCMHIWQALATTPSYMDDPTTIVLLSWLDEKPLPVSKRALERLLQSITDSESQYQLRLIAGLNRLLRRPWWGRVWVLQEIALPGLAYFACGTKRISRQRFRAALNTYYAFWHLMALKIQHRQALTQYELKVFFMATHRAKLMLTMSQVYRTERFSLVGLLRATCVGSVYHLQQDGYQHLDSTDPRDKIFALLGLAEDQKELEALGVVPDYRRSKEQIYMATMTALLQQGHVSMLSFCRLSERPGDLPSWAPDWSVPMVETLQDVKPDHITLYPEFNAAGLTRQCQVIVSKKTQGPNEIAILAILYDEIFQVGDVPRIPATGTCMLPEHWLYEILRLTYVGRNIYKNFKSRLQAVVRTSHAATGMGSAAMLERVDRYSDALPILKSEIHVIRRKDMKLGLQKFFASKEAKADLELTCGDPSRLVHEFMRITPKRIPFVTVKGYIGLASHCARNGDVVSVISGAQIPFILRPCDGGKYRIVSEAYVDGIMDGEAVDNAVWNYIELA
jgi:hypothetical protein